MLSWKGSWAERRGRVCWEILLRVLRKALQQHKKTAESRFLSWQTIVRRQNCPIAPPHPLEGWEKRPPVPVQWLNVQQGFLKSIFHCCSLQPGTKC